MSPKKRTSKKKPAPAPAPAPEPATVRVRVVRRYVGSPDEGTVLDVTETGYLRKLIRNGFLKQVK